jgi:transposase-like protein
MKEPKTLQQAIQYFSDPDNCLKYMVDRRWPDGVPICPTCGSKEVRFLKTRRLWECKHKHSRQQFSIKIGTVMEDSAVGLDKWLVAMWMVANCKNGVSSWEIHRTIGVTQKTAWFMLHRIRLSMKREEDGSKLGSNEGGEVEVDETFVGPNPKNMHKDRKLRYNQQRNETGNAKTIVQGILDRDARQVRAKVVPNIKRETLQAEVLRNVKYGSAVYTDELVAYDKLKWRYIHDVVNHAEQYVKGRVHTNGLENFWSLFKRNLRGTYVAVEPFHLERYVDEQVFRYNNRATHDNPLGDSDRMILVASQVLGKRLTYKELTGKNGSQA